MAFYAAVVEQVCIAQDTYVRNTISYIFQYQILKITALNGMKKVGYWIKIVVGLLN